MTANVVAGIHWQALKLWWKGVPLDRTGRSGRSVEGAMSMVTQWAKTAFLAGLRGVRGGTLTLKCPDRTYRTQHCGERDERVRGDDSGK
jgi:hypothetical protein